MLLTRLTQELKTLKELRDYAGMLLQEAEQMFLADLEGKRPEKERVRRLQETIECGRQLYAQRAALEGPLAAGLLDAQIEVALSAETGDPLHQGTGGRRQPAPIPADSLKRGLTPCLGREPGSGPVLGVPSVSGVRPRLAADSLVI